MASGSTRRKQSAWEFFESWHQTAENESEAPVATHPSSKPTGVARHKQEATIVRLPVRTTETDVPVKPNLTVTEAPPKVLAKRPRIAAGTTLGTNHPRIEDPSDNGTDRNVAGKTNRKLSASDFFEQWQQGAVPAEQVGRASTRSRLFGDHPAPSSDSQKTSDAPTPARRVSRGTSRSRASQQEAITPDLLQALDTNLPGIPDLPPATEVSFTKDEDEANVPPLPAQPDEFTASRPTRPRRGHLFVGNSEQSESDRLKALETLVGKLEQRALRAETRAAEAQRAAARAERETDQARRMAQDALIAEEAKSGRLSNQLAAASRELASLKAILDEREKQDRLRERGVPVTDTSTSAPQLTQPALPPSPRGFVPNHKDPRAAAEQIFSGMRPPEQDAEGSADESLEASPRNPLARARPVQERVSVAAPHGRTRQVLVVHAPGTRSPLSALRGPSKPDGANQQTTHANGERTILTLGGIKAVSSKQAGAWKAANRLRDIVASGGDEGLVAAAVRLTLLLSMQRNGKAAGQHLKRYFDDVFAALSRIEPCLPTPTSARHVVEFASAPA